MSINPATWPLAGKIVGLFGVVAVGAASTTMVVTAGSAPEPGVSSYLCSLSAEKMLLQWQSGGSGITGTYQDVQLTGTAPSESVSASSGILTGMVNGSGITLRLDVADTWYGTVSSSAALLNVPQGNGTIQQVTCARSDVSTWNAAVAALNAQAGTDNNTAERQAAQQQAQQQQQQQEQQAQADVTTLIQDTSPLTSDLSTVAGDVKATGADLSQTRSDAANGNGQECVNASTTVHNDAATTVYNDVQTTIYNDVNTVSTDISRLRSDIQTVQNDQAALSNAGLPGTSGTEAAVSAAQSTITSVLSAVNADIAQANSDLSAAYAIANSVGTGTCAGDGPGNTPAGLSPLH